MTPQRNGRQGGTALLLVIWVVALLSLLAATALQITTTTAHIAQAGLIRARLQAASEGAINLALLELIDPDSNSRWPVDGTVRTFEVAGQQVSVSIRDEAGNVDVNRAPDALLKAVFMSAGASADDAEKWLTALNSRRPGSDGNAGTGTLGRNDHATLIRTADELGVIAGMPAATFRCIRPALTVYTGLQNVDKRYAAAIVRRALTNPTTGEAAPVLDVPAPDAAGGESFAGRVFSIQATVVGENSRFFQRVILRVTGDPGRPYLLALWDESGDEDSAGDTGTDCR